MDHYLTTYSKDYVWPNVGAYSKGKGGPLGGTTLKATPEEIEFLEACLKYERPGDCRCPQYGGQGAGQAGSGDTQHWTGAQPLGTLLEPKLFTGQVGTPPDDTTNKYKTPNPFLEKLSNKFPLLYSILQSAPNAEMRSRIERDRNKTTYQVDYCDSGPGAQFENLQRAADFSGTGECAGPMRLPGDPCRTGTVKRMPRTATITKNSAPGTKSDSEGGGGGGGSGSGGGGLTEMPPLGKTEYQDGVSKLGSIIMRDKLHRKN